VAICCMEKETRTYLIDAVERWIEDNRHVLEEAEKVGAYNQYRTAGARKGIRDMENILLELRDTPAC